MRRWTTAALAIALTLVVPARAQEPSNRYDRDTLEGRKPAELATAPEEGDEYLAAGEVLYLKHCAPCHGDSGMGDGAAAAVMYPRPRDFTAANYGFRITRSGELPTDADLFRSISRGIPGTAMPAWGEGEVRLSEDERWKLVYYVKHLTGLYWDEFADPYRELAEGDLAPIVELPASVPVSDELLERGRELYMDETGAGCVRCHGETGRGYGNAAAEQLDDLGRPVRPSDLTNPWRIKNGATVADYFRTLTTGISGTPMPAFEDALEAEDRWALAHYARSLLEERTLPTGPLHAHEVGETPTDPDDEAWERCDPLGVPLMGQMIVAPRWQAPSVDYVELCALYDDDSIAIRAQWNDPFLDDGAGDTHATTDADTPADDPTPADDSTLDDATLDDDATPDDDEPPLDDDATLDDDDATLDDDEPPLDDDATPASEDETDGEGPPTYISIDAMNARAAAGALPDRVALHMPVGKRDPDTVERPHMLLGDPEHSIQAWQWSAEGGGTFAESVAAGAEESYQPQDPEAVQLEGASSWKEGRWRVVFRRTLLTDDGSRDAQLEPGVLMPVSIRVWDGSAGEAGLQSAMSSWQHVYLEAPVGVESYARAGIATLLGYLLIGFGWRRLRG